MILEYKAIEKGCEVVVVNPMYTSQFCNACGSFEEKVLSQRTHQCSNCGYVAHRDLNASKNILRLGLESQGNPQEAPTIPLG